MRAQGHGLTHAAWGRRVLNTRAREILDWEIRIFAEEDLYRLPRWFAERHARSETG